MDTITERSNRTVLNAATYLVVAKATMEFMMSADSDEDEAKKMLTDCTFMNIDNCNLDNNANPGHIHFWLAPQPDPRAWSADVSVADSSNIYTIRAFLGDPDATLPYWMKAEKKFALQRLLQRCGFDDISGTKDALLHRFQTGKPYVDFRIDSRECLQRMLVVAMHSWGWEDCPGSHCFTATLPARGDCPWGIKRLGELDCLRDCYHTINTGSFGNNNGNKWKNPYNNTPEKWLKRTLLHAGPALNRATLDDLLAHRLSLNDMAPFRTVDGVGFEPGAVGKPFTSDPWCHDVGGALSLEQCSLRAGDRISILYDFCRMHTVVFQVLNLDEGQAVLPELSTPFPTRAFIGQSGGARVLHLKTYGV